MRRFQIHTQQLRFGMLYALKLAPLVGGFLLALSLLTFAGYRLTSYNRPVAHKEYQTAAASIVADKPLVLLNEAMVRLKQREADEAKQLLSQAYEACLDENGEVQNSRAPLAATIKFRQGNLLVHLQDIQGAIDAYSESLRLEPHNLEAKYNLELLLLQSGGNGGGKPIVVPGSSEQRDQGI